MVSLLTLWGAVASVIVFVEPELLKDIFLPGVYLPFWMLIGFALWYTLAIVCRSIVKGLVVTATVLGGLILSMLGLMHWGLAAVLILTLGIESWYIYKKR